MPVYEIITESDKRIIPFEESEAWKLSKYSEIDKRIEETLGPPKVSKIHIDSYFYANPGKRFHIDVLAENGDEAMKIIKENREKLEEVYELFGKIPGNYRIWGKRSEDEELPHEKRSLLERLRAKFFA